MTYHTLTQSLVYHEHPREVSVRRLALFMMIFCLAGYGYLTVSSVLHAVVQRDTAEKISEKQNVLAVLERDYAEIARSITTQRAEEFQLVATSDKVFASRTVTLGQATR
ncbi:MAG: hypothetical protein AAB421_04850 [Patescibacteria group bacterium]